MVKGKPLYVGLAEKREVRAERLRTWVLLLEDGKGEKKKELKDCIGCESLGERFGAKGDDLFPYKKGELKSSKNLPNHRVVTMGKGNEATKKKRVGGLNQ